MLSLINPNQLTNIYTNKIQYNSNMSMNKYSNTTSNNNIQQNYDRCTYMKANHNIQLDNVTLRHNRNLTQSRHVQWFFDRER